LKDKKKIKVSVAIPVFNEQGSLKDFLERMLSQTINPDEIIFCDGGSTDRTVSILDGYKKKFTNIKLVNREGLCRGSGRNSAIEASSNELVALIDVGNVPETNWLELLIEELIRFPELEVVYGAVKPQQNNSITKSLSSFILGKKEHNQLLDKSVASMLIRKETWMKAGKFPQSEDGSYIVEDLRFLNKLENLDLKTIKINSAFTNWSLPDNYLDIYKRFYNLTLGANKIGYTKLLLGGVLRNYLICLLIFISSFFLNAYLLFLIPCFLLLRVYSYHRFNIWFKGENLFVKSLYLLQGLLVFSIIDFASINSFMSSRLKNG
tara:strand:- start:925 stop:1887 length:963 start_codon:yes stop_codon:yes gene_type:complete